MRRLLLALCALGTFAAGWSPAVAGQALWEKLAPRKQVPADPQADYSLTQEQGPWLVLAASFTGTEGEGQARKLVLELRRDFQVPAWYYGMTFKMDPGNPGRGIDADGAPIKRRYKRGDQVVEHAVLAGEFPSIGDPEAQRLLKRIKGLKPASLATGEGEQTAQSLATVRQFHQYLRKKLGHTENNGPMNHAFLTRNPLLPREYFVPQGVDEDVAKWNEGLEYSLMKCPGKYSIRVATFRGRTSLASNLDEPEESRTHKASDDDPLVVAGRNAHLLTVALREKGWDAYEFHDRLESYVAVGSFDQAQTLPTGQLMIPDREARIIINTFGATTPGNIFERPAPQDERLEEIQKERFNNLLASQHGAVAEGFHPKRFVGMPFDIVPQPVVVPRRSISSAYARN
jgi:hypothetical protein